MSDSIAKQVQPAEPVRLPRIFKACGELGFSARHGVNSTLPSGDSGLPNFVAASTLPAS
jgi:hypothetical protein